MVIAWSESPVTLNCSTDPTPSFCVRKSKKKRERRTNFCRIGIQAIESTWKGVFSVTRLFGYFFGDEKSNRSFTTYGSNTFLCGTKMIFNEKMELEGLISSIPEMGKMQTLPKLFELFFIFQPILYKLRLQVWSEKQKSHL